MLSLYIKKWGGVDNSGRTTLYSCVPISLADLLPIHHYVGKESDPPSAIEPCTVNPTISDRFDCETTCIPAQQTANRYVIDRDADLFNVDATKCGSTDVLLTSLAYSSTLDTGESIKPLLLSKVLDPLDRQGIPYSHIYPTEEDCAMDGSRFNPILLKATLIVIQQPHILSHLVIKRYQSPKRNLSETIEKSHRLIANLDLDRLKRTVMVS